MTADDLRARFAGLPRDQLVDALVGVACSLYEPGPDEELDADSEWSSDTPAAVLEVLLPILPRELTGAGAPDVDWGQIPEAVRFVAQSGNGGWYGFKTRPLDPSAAGVWASNWHKVLTPEQSPYYAGPWDQSLVERPS